MSESCTDDTHNPLKRRWRKKKSQGGLTDHLEPHPAEMQDVDMGLIVKQGTTTHPAAKQGVKQKPVVSLPMSITGQLPCPLGKVAVFHTLHPLQWYNECETMDTQFVEAAAIASDTPAANHTPEQCGVFCHHHHTIRDVQPPRFPVDVNTPKDICYWIGEWLWNPIGMP